MMLLNELIDETFTLIALASKVTMMMLECEDHKLHFAQHLQAARSINYTSPELYRVAVH